MKRTRRVPRTYLREGKVLTARAFADALRESEMVRIHHWGL
jgi:hypothetical protein